MMKPCIEIQDLTVCYNEAAPIVEGINLRCHYGDFVLISGSSGSGKSTLLNCLNGIIPHFTPAKMTGRICIDGQEVSEKSIVERSYLVGSVLQNADEQIINDQVEDEVAFALENMAVARDAIQEIIDHALKLMKLKGTMHTKTLSGGEKQRLITATTLAMKQKIILLDEPLANLDATGATLLLDTLEQLCQEEGYCVVVIEHRLEMILPYCNKVFA